MKKIVIAPRLALAIQKRPSLLLFTIAIGVHQKTAKSLHESIKRKVPLYDRFWQWQNRKRIRVPTVIIMGLLVVTFVFSQFYNAFALSNWSQSDWSGGVGSSTVNQFAASTNTVTSTTNQITLSGKANWYNAAWQYRKQITIDHTKIATDQTNFPVLIKETSDADLAARAQSSGNDIVITDSTGTALLNYEIENYTTASGALIAWVKVPTLSSTVDTTLYMYYGNSVISTSLQNPTAVWDSTYEGVWHLGANGASVSTKDSTSHARNGTNNGATSYAGQIGQGVKVLGNGTTYIDAGANPILGSLPFTMSAWVNTPQANNYGGAMSIGGSTSGGAAYIGTVSSVSSGGGNSLGGGFYGLNIGSGSVQANQWSYLTLTYGGGSNGLLTLYLNGVSKSSATYTGALTSSTIKIGRIADDTAYDFAGYVDEARLSNNTRPISWITTNYNNQSSPSTFESLASEERNFQSTASLTSNIYDTGVSQDWANLTYSSTVPAGTTVSVKVRAGSVADLSDTPSFSACAVVASGVDMTSSCVPDKARYVQYQINFTSNGNATPVFSNISLSYRASDATPPPTNASSVQMYKSNGGAQLSSNGWVNNYPYATWTAGADDFGGSGIKGYCLYLGHDPTGNPITTKGYLGNSPVDTGGTCQFTVSSTNIDLSQSGNIGTALESSTTPYYLNIVAIDNAGNTYVGSAAQFQFRYDNTPPTNPAFVSAPSQFVSSKVVNLTWPTSGGQQADDATSGVAGLQYKIGSGGTWYGTNHTGVATDLLPNNGSYTTVSSPDFANLVEGANIVYFRTIDNAGNLSTAYVTGVIKLNTTSPSSPQNLSATPTTNTTNSFAFNWLAPATYGGSVGNITYCYTINTLPNANNCQYTQAGKVSLSAGAYATQPGDNTFYVVAKDEAGNVNYTTAASTTFTANTSAPGVPTSLDIADISVKVNQIWKVALSWETPTMTGAGIATYHVYRSTDGNNYINVASTAGTSYVDTGLNQQTYYYKIAACDSANNCGALTTPVQMYPTGKYTSPAVLVTGPDVVTTTRTATITWTTDRNSDSKIEYGLTTGNYFSTSASNIQQTNAHTITLNNLDPSTTYFFRSNWADIDGNSGTSIEQKFTTLPAPTVSNVTVTGVNLSEATINFTTSGATTATVYYGQNGSLGETKEQDTSTSLSRYSIPLSDLVDGTEYSFRIDTTDDAGNTYKSGQINVFSTPPAPHITNVQFEPVSGALSGTEKISWTTNVATTSQIRYAQQGQPFSSGREAIDTTMTTDHTMTIDSLTYGTPYQIIATSQDAIGNIANSDIQIFRTGLDTRPPLLSSVTVQSSIQGTGASASGQIIVSWKTDKTGSSQVAYGQGSTGDYSSKTAEDTSMVKNHVVVISNLPTSEVFHLQAISRDEAGNIGVSEGQTTIVSQGTDSALSIVFNALRSVFGL